MFTNQIVYSMLILSKTYEVKLKHYSVVKV